MSSELLQAFSLITENLPDSWKADNSLDQWEGVTVSPTDATSVIAVSLPQRRLRGPIIFSALPRSLQKLDLSHNNLSGNLDTADLPPALVELNVSKNMFKGNFDTAKLSRLPNLRKVDISNNSFCGTLDVTAVKPEVECVFEMNGFNDVKTGRPSTKGMLCVIQ